VGLGGLSESGKGSVANELTDRYGFSRLKIGYFNEIVREGTGEQYGDPHEIAMNIVRFIANNRHLRRITLESFHSPNLAAELKLLLGERWQSIMLEVDKETRQRRTIEESRGEGIEADKAIATQAAKDTTKIERGALEYGHLADLRIDNSGPIEQTVSNIAKGLTICER